MTTLGQHQHHHHDEHDYIRDELLVATETAGELEPAVGKLLKDSTLGLTLERVPAENCPATVALIKADVASGAALDFKAIRVRHPYVSPNYVVVPMVHAKFLPINYPRPAPAPQATADAAKSNVNVVVIDSPPISEHAATGHAHDISTTSLHGTFVTSIIQQLEPSARVRLLPIADRNDDDFYSDWELACQLASLNDDPPDVVNLSLGVGPIDGEALGLGRGEYPRATAAAIRELKVAAKEKKQTTYIVAAAGNDGLDDDIVYPAKFDDVLVVGAQARQAGRRPRPASWSNGVDSGVVDFWAPGVSLLGATLKQKHVTFSALESPVALNRRFADDLPFSSRKDLDFDGWAYWDGTSFATPVISARLAKAIAAKEQDPVAVVRAEFGEQGNINGFDLGAYPVPQRHG